jgi:hypothetical protein
MEKGNFKNCRRTVMEKAFNLVTTQLSIIYPIVSCVQLTQFAEVREQALRRRVDVPVRCPIHGRAFGTCRTDLVC